MQRTLTITSLRTESEDLGLYQCPDSSCTASPAFCKSCTDLGLLECPDTGECVLTADACPATCEANGQVTCPNLACADSAADCGTEECTDMGLIKCGLDGSCVADPEQCPSCESIGRYTCPAASDGDSVVVCSDDPALCPGVDGSCEAMDLVECDTEIGGYHLCAPTADMCPGAECPWEKPVVCSDGSCAEDVETCDYYEQPLDLTCEDFEWVTCADGTWYVSSPCSPIYIASC